MASDPASVEEKGRESIAPSDPDAYLSLEEREAIVVIPVFSK